MKPTKVKTIFIVKRQPDPDVTVNQKIPASQRIECLKKVALQRQTITSINIAICRTLLRLNIFTIILIAVVLRASEEFIRHFRHQHTSDRMS